MMRARTPWSRPRTRLGSLLVVALFAAACGSGDGTSGPEEPDPSDSEETAQQEPGTGSADESAADPLEELYAAAAEEGSVVVAIPSAAENYEHVWEAWEARFPDVTVSTISIASTQMAARMISEDQAGAMSMDVGMSRPDAIAAIWERDLAVSEDWQALNPDIPDDYIMFDGNFLRAHDFLYGWMYNTEVVDENDVPQTWEDLLDERWSEQKLSIIASGDLSLGAMLISGEWDEDDVRDYVTRLVAQNPAVEARGTPIANAVATGQVPLGNTPLTVLPLMREEGAPIAAAPVGPLLVVPFGVFVPEGGPNPNAGKLFAAWLAGPEGAEALKAGGRGLATDCEASELGQVICEAGIELVVTETTEDLKVSERAREIAHEILLDADLVPEDEDA